MRRFFDYDFDGLELSSRIDVFGPAITAFVLPELFAAVPFDLPLFANVDGTTGDDTLNGTADADTINGFAGNDIINGLGGDDILNGGDGDDIISGGEGFDTIDGGTGFDLVNFAGASERVSIFLSEGSFSNNLVTATNVEGAIGTDFGDTFSADTSQTNSVYFDGGAGNDRFFGGAGDDTFIGGAGDDFARSIGGSDTFDGGAGSDRLSTFSLGLSFNPTQAYSADLALGQVINNGLGETITLINVEGLSGGTFFADSFLGDDNDNVILGNLGGADTVNGFGGNDLLSLASGTGSVDGGSGVDEFYFTGAIYDTVLQDFRPYFQGSEINLTSGTLTDGFGETGGVISNIENIRDTDLSDVLIGNAQDNIITLSRGEDVADGGAGVDTVSFLRSGAIIADLAAGTATQSVDALVVSTPSALDSSFLAPALDDSLTIRLFTTDAQSGTMRGSFRGIQSDVTDAAGVRTIVFNPFGLDDTQLGQPQFSSATGEAFVTMIIDAAGNLTYTATVTYNDLPGSITAITFRYGDTIDTIHFMIADGILGQADIVDQISNFENILGSAFGDTLTGDAGDNGIEGGGGNDIIDGGDGSDTAIYIGEQSQYTITNNEDGTYTIIDTIGLEGTDTLSGIEAVQFSDGTLLLSNAPAPINGTLNNDNLMGTADADIINGLAGNDIISGLAGDDTLNGGDGADRLIGGEGADVLNGGAGFDSADYRGATSGVRFNVETGGTLGEAAGDTFSGIERYYLSDFNDVITGSDANEFFFGEDGNDQINGGGGIDRIYGGDGNDIQRGQGGNDTLYGSAGNDQLNGGAGFDIANYTLASAAVTVNMLTGGTGGDAAGDTYFGIEAVYGSDFDDSLTGNNSVNELRGFDGDDVLIGLGGNDRFFGGEGADSFDGGTGTDIVNYTLATEEVFVDLVNGGIMGEADGDTFTSIEWVFGSAFDDFIFGDEGNNRLEGRDGDDILDGAAGNDRLLGGDGNDTIMGGDGVDTIFGQAGDDVLFGGAGNDFFFGDEGSDFHEGGDGIDTVSYLASSSGLTIDMEGFFPSTGDAAGDTFTSIERIFGSGHDDTILGDSDDQTLIGNGGDDLLWGREGADSLTGGAGNDRFHYDGIFDGADVITDFRSGATSSEVIEFAPTDINTFAGLMAIASNAGANTIFDFGGGNTLTVVGSNIADFVADDFQFSASSPSFESPDNSDVFAEEMIDVFAEEMMEVLDMDALF